MIQAIFFDIDGTLIPYGKDTMPESTIKALWKMKEKGIKLFIATGRPPNSIEFARKLFPFDGFLTANGQYCFNEETLIFEKYIPKDSFKQLLPYIEENHIPILCALLDKSYRNYQNPNSHYDDCWPIIDLREIMDENIIQIMAYVDEKDDALFLSHLPHCKSARWTSAFADIIPEEGGKDRGIDRIIEHYGIPLSHVMAFGDGGNDITMLEHVPYGVAMGNASDNVKAHAAYVTTDIEDDGIANALIHFGVLEKVI